MEEDLRFDFIKDISKSLENIDKLMASPKPFGPKFSENLFNSDIPSADENTETKIPNPYNCESPENPEFKVREKEFLEDFIENLLESFPEDKKEIIRKEARKHL
jgi:hypothetical protein